MTETISVVYPEGSLLRATEHTDGGLNAGEEFIAEEYVEERPGGAEPDDIPAPFYYGSVRGGMNNVWCEASKVELVKTVEEMRARTVPEKRKVVEEIQSNLMDHYDGFEIDETHREGEDVMLFGTAENGLPIAIRVRVMSVEQVDY